MTHATDLRVYFVGSHSTGKTTCARWVSATYGLPMLPEVARQIMAEMEVSLERLRVDLDLVNVYQSKVLERQLTVEKNAGSRYVSDRAFDNLAYAAEHATHFFDLVHQAGVNPYVDHVRGGIVFFVRPHVDMLRADGARESPVWEGVVRIDGMIKFMLEFWAIPYLPIASASMQERARAIDAVLRRVDRGN